MAGGEAVVGGPAEPTPGVSAPCRFFADQEIWSALRHSGAGAAMPETPLARQTRLVTQQANTRA
jgi:hypothetical protein